MKMLRINGLSSLKVKLPTTHYMTAQEFCDIMGVPCPAVYADKQIGIPVSGIKRIMDAAGESEVELELVASIPTTLPTVTLEDRHFARKADREKDRDKQREMWLEINAYLFQLLHIRCAAFECTISVKAFSGTPLPTKLKAVRSLR